MTPVSGRGAKATDHVPILLLKTKSSPTDAYEDIFSQPHDGLSFEPTFVPVLEHKFDEYGMKTVKHALDVGKMGSDQDNFGGIIFTSQRAVEAFTRVVQDGPDEENQLPHSWPNLQNVPIYSVGPATTRALKVVPQEPSLQVFGEHTGNGDNLAHFILKHYAEWYQDRQWVKLPPLLFPCGEERRDIIPKTLMNDQLPTDKRIDVEETVVYSTGVMEKFADEFKRHLHETQENKMVWVVVFSPTGCDAMLRGLGLLDGTTGKAKAKDPERTRYIATIGPTTRAHLLKKFDFEPDVCADQPSPEGVLTGIKQFLLTR